MTPFVQNLIAAGIGLIALVYLLKRWWPSWLALLKPTVAASGCQTGSQASPACGSGCGQCGSANASARKDHRVHVVKTPPSTH